MYWDFHVFGETWNNNFYCIESRKNTHKTSVSVSVLSGKHWCMKKKVNCVLHNFYVFVCSQQLRVFDFMLSCSQQWIWCLHKKPKLAKTFCVLKFCWFIGRNICLWKNTATWSKNYIRLIPDLGQHNLFPISKPISFIYSWEKFQAIFVKFRLYVKSLLHFTKRKYFCVC